MKQIAQETLARRSEKDVGLPAFARFAPEDARAAFNHARREGKGHCALQVLSACKMSSMRSGLCCWPWDEVEGGAALILQRGLSSLRLQRVIFLVLLGPKKRRRESQG